MTVRGSVIVNTNGNQSPFKEDAMLVLSRKKGERIIIGENAEIVLEVVEIIGNKIRLGIIAPRDVPVYRQELLEQKKSSGVEQQPVR